MIIKSLELENIRSYKKEKIEFENGINFLSGDIGSGKSTILLAIEFALFGFKKGDLEGFHLLRKGEREGEIKLILENGVNTIEIFRKIKKGKSNELISQENGYIKINDNLIELAPSEINANIFELLNFPKEFLTKDKNLIYRFTIYTAQEQLKEIIFAENEKRLEVIRKIFNIDKYKQLKDAISIYSIKLREDKKVLAVKLEPINTLLDEIILLEKNVENINLDIVKITTSENLLHEKIKKYEDAISKRDEYIEKLSEKILLIEKKLSQIEEIEKNILSLEKEKDKKNKTLEENQKKDYTNLNLIISKNLKELEEKRAKTLEDKNIISLKIKEFDNLKIEKDTSLKQINEIETKKKIILNEEKNIDLKNIKLKILEIIEKKEKIKEIIEKNTDAIKIYEKEKETILKLKIEISNINEKIEEKSKSVHDALKHDNCPTCLQEVSKKHKDNLNLKIKAENEKSLILKKDLEEKLENIINNLPFHKTNAEILEKSNKTLIELETNLNNLKELEENEKVKINILDKLKKELLEYELKKPYEKLEVLMLKLNEEKLFREKIENLNNEDIKIRENIFKLNSEIKDNTLKFKEIGTIKEELTEIEKNIKEQTQKIENKKSYKEKIIEYREAERKFKEEKIKLNETLNSYKKEDKELNSALSSLKTKFEINTKLIQEKKKNIENLEKIKISYEKLLSDENFLLTKAINIIQIIEKTLFTKYYSEFSDSFENFFKELIEDNNIDIRLDSEFTPIIEQNGYDIDIKNLSGGEKSSIAIAYRLALKQIIETNITSQKLSLLILDEPTDGFSKEQIDRLGNILREIKLKQIIIVSHDEKIETISDRVFYIEKNNHISQIGLQSYRATELQR